MTLTDKELAPRLCTANAAALLPYDRSKLTPGIVHLGVGAFHRAHFAAYINEVLEIDPSWAIIGASLRRPDARAVLAPQDFLYTLVERGESETKTRVIGSIVDVLDATAQRPALIAAMTDPRIRIVSLTVTEKGYCHDPATGRLDPRHPDILHDLATADAPVSAPGLIVRALELRRAAGTEPFTVLSCDNLPANGETTARIVFECAALRDADLAGYIRSDVAFPSTMVDRIVPATSDLDRDLALERLAMRDAWPVVTEPFTQWVIEDDFPTGRPAVEIAGAQLVADVRPYELTKLRMLNGSHSIIAYAGYLAGYAHVSEAIADPAFHCFIHAFMTDEVMPTLPGDFRNPAAYRDALLDRFRNPALRHRTWQIAMDGSQKLPQRLLGTIRDRLARNLPVTRAALGVAAWMRYVAGVDEQGREIDVRDPLAARFRSMAQSAGDSPGRLVDGLLEVREVFGDDLPRSGQFRAVLVRLLESLVRDGALDTVRRLNRAGSTDQ